MCDCVKNINEKLIEHNTRISMSFTITRDLSTMGSALTVPTEKIDKKNRKKPMTMIASYCPFCGKKWEG